MFTLLQCFKSRTVQTAVATGVFNVFEAFLDPSSQIKLTPTELSTINFLLTVLTAYFRMNPKQ